MERAGPFRFESFFLRSQEKPIAKPLRQGRFRLAYGNAWDCRLAARVSGPTWGIILLGCWDVGQRRRRGGRQLRFPAEVS